MTTAIRRPERRASKTGTDGYRHGDACAWRGQPLVQHSLADRSCCCDPHGTKDRAVAVALEKRRRRSVLTQDEVWFPKDGSEVRLVDMSLRWKRNLMAFLERHAEVLWAQEARRVAGWSSNGEAAQDSLDQILDELLDTKPVTWLYSTPFMAALERLVREEQDGPVDR